MFRIRSNLNGSEFLKNGSEFLKTSLLCGDHHIVSRQQMVDVIIEIGSNSSFKKTVYKMRNDSFYKLYQGSQLFCVGLEFSRLHHSRPTLLNLVRV